MLKNGLSDRGYRTCAKNWSVFSYKTRQFQTRNKISTYQMQDSLTARTTKRVREIVHKHVRLVAEKA